MATLSRPDVSQHLALLERFRAGFEQDMQNVLNKDLSGEIGARVPALVQRYGLPALNNYRDADGLGLLQSIVRDDAVAIARDPQDGRPSHRLAVLLEAGLDPDAHTPGTSAPLLMAARYSAPFLAQQLLDDGANPSVTNDDGMTALHVAVVSESVHVMNTLIDHGTAIDATDTWGDTALSSAVSTGHRLLDGSFSTKMVDLLIERGADPNLAMTCKAWAETQEKVNEWDRFRAPDAENPFRNNMDRVRVAAVEQEKQSLNEAVAEVEQPCVQAPAPRARRRL